MRFAFHPIKLVMGFIIWSLWFVVLYAALSLYCQLKPNETIFFNFINLGLMVFTLLSFVILACLAYKLWQVLRKTRRKESPLRYFILWVGFSVYLFAAMATLSIGMMAIFYPPCL